MMKYSCQILTLDEYVQGCAVVQIEECEIPLTVFIGYSLEAFHVGSCYEMELELYFADELVIDFSEQDHYSIEKLQKGFSYVLRGKLSKSEITTIHPLKFFVDTLPDQYMYEGKFCQLVATRIDASIIREVKISI